jgi:hypothetical protein
MSVSQILRLSRRVQTQRYNPLEVTKQYKTIQKKTMHYKSQLSLNLVAVAVALMTFSILLGPLLQIPQTVPAVLTLGILSLAAVDQFGFQGWGGNLFLDGLAQLSPSYRQRVLQHEAGHFLVAHLLGLTITGYRLSVWQAWQQRNEDAPNALVGVSVAVPTQVAITELDRYCTLWMAGIAAEEWIYGQADGGNDDRLQVATLAEAYSRDPELQQRQALLRAKQLLKTHETTYQDLVAAMGTGAAVADCQAIIDQASALNTLV